MDGRSFVRFPVDIGIGDVISEPVEIVATRDWLRFGNNSPKGFTSTQYRARTQTVGFAIWWISTFLAECGSLERGRSIDALRRTFERRSTHDVPRELSPPTGEGNRPFRAMADECGIEINCQGAFEMVRSLWTRLSR